MKSSNKLLVAILLGLVLIFFGTNYFKKKNSKTVLDSNLISIDTAKISKIEIIKALDNKKDILFTNNKNEWEVKQGIISSKVKNSDLKNMLNLLEKLKIERLVAKSEKQWGIYKLGDSLATKIRIEENETGKISTLYLGKMKYEQPKNQYNRYGVNGSTYLRINNDPKVYAVKGLLSSTFNRDFNSWRNSDIIKLNKNDVNTIEFNYPKEENFILSKKDSIWNVNDQIADAEKINQYLTTLSYKSHSKFADEFMPSSNYEYQLKIDGDNMNSIELEAYKDSLSGKFYLKSTLNSNTFFESDSTLFKSLFRNKKDLL